MTASSATPRNAVVILLDSLNRHLLGAYGSDEFTTPNLDAFAARSTRFTNHFVGSLPCMPARHDILVGALDFLWRPWGSIELWEDSITYPLRLAGVTTMLCSDHPHLFETGGENYHTDFAAWDYQRGHENDPWKTRPDPSWVGTPALPAASSYVKHNYDDARTWFRDEADFPGPRTMAAAADWLANSAPETDRFLLFVDEFDPHEPFDTPEPWASRYDDETWTDPRVIWPPYAAAALRKGVLDERTARHIRNNYGAKLSMIDHWFGRILDAMEGHWHDTALIVCTDHGHYLGEHDAFGKPSVPIWGTLGHIPLLIHWPGGEPGTCDALTTSVDLHATLADLFGVTVEHRTHGHSLVPLLSGEATSVRDWALFGYWGRHVGITDGTHRYHRGSGDSNYPLSMWSNRWSTMPIPFPEFRLPRPDRRATLDFMPGSEVPVIRQPFAEGDKLPFWAMGARPPETLLYDVSVDPGEDENRAGESVEAEFADLLREALVSVEAPSDQFARLDLR